LTAPLDRKADTPTNRRAFGNAMMIAGHRTGWLQRTDKVNKNGTRIYRVLKRPPEGDDLPADWRALAMDLYHSLTDEQLERQMVGDD
jgi:hypothetical protein